MSHKVFDSDLIQERKNKVTLTLKKPAYIGRCILESRKVVLILEFLYNYIRNKYGGNLRQLFTDTGSLMYEI